ncbi:MAG: LysR family transcriptional regulator, partial [Oscillospiraceae bacterium]|nr:LysR family transcriptional regulator [Oscillospiraceae bacterium]
MNILHLKYAVEVEKTRSISKAAENLYMGQPNLSRAIKELEESLGITVFKRTTKGISITPDGEEFLRRARRIVSQVEEMEDIYRNGRIH